jgi:hypothetical protein
MNLDDPTAVALLAAEALGRAGIEHALYGGLLLAAYGAARETRDADMAVAGASAADAARSLGASGLRTAIAFERKRFGGVWVSRVTLLGGTDASGLNTLDLVEPRSLEYARRALGRALSSTLRGQSIRLLTPEDFVVFKVLSTRALDLDDARTVLSSVGPELDLGQVESDVATLERELPDHAVAERWRRVLTGAG